MENQERKLISIKEMENEFGVSRRTIYDKYKPFLEHVPTKDNRVYFNYEAAVALHKKIVAEAEDKKRRGVNGAFAKYKIIA